jgi:chaperonin GroEL (HSP60 family)
MGLADSVQATHSLSLSHAVLKLLLPWLLVCCRLDLRDIKVVCKVGGTMDDSELIDGMVFDQKVGGDASRNCCIV